MGFMKDLQKDLDSGALPPEEIPGFIRYLGERLAAWVFYICFAILLAGLGYLVLNPQIGG